MKKFTILSQYLKTSTRNIILWKIQREKDKSSLHETRKLIFVLKKKKEKRKKEKRIIQYYVNGSMKKFNLIIAH